MINFFKEGILGIFEMLGGLLLIIATALLVFWPVVGMTILAQDISATGQYLTIASIVLWFIVAGVTIRNEKSSNKF